MASSDVRPLKERVNLRVALTVVLTGSAGIAALILSAQGGWWERYEVWQTLLRELGALLLVTVIITILWDLVGKRAFLDEVCAKARVSAEIRLAGISSVTTSYNLSEIDWGSLFKNVKKLDLFFSYARTWRNTHLQELKRLAASKGARIRVVLPDPGDDLTVRDLARRFDCSTTELVSRIEEAAAFFRNLRPSSGSDGAQVIVWFLPAAPLYAFYRFDRVVVLTLHGHRRERAPFPTFVCEQDGTLYEYVRQEFEAMIKANGLAKPDSA